jgi:lipid-A-disaccharide synthase
MEVRQLLPVMVEALKAIPESTVSEAILVEAPGMESAIGDLLKAGGSDPRLRRVGGDERRRELASSRFAWTASGTATLECTLLGVPMIVGYRLQPISFALAKLLVSVPHVALVNLIAGRRVVPELLQGDWNPEKLSAATLKLFEDGLVGQQEGLAMARARLGDPGASRNAAEAISEYLG